MNGLSTKQIQLKDAEAVMNFAKEVTASPYTVQISDGITTVTNNSLLALFTLDMSRSLTCTYYGR